MSIKKSMLETGLPDGFFEYLLVAHPDGEVAERIFKEKAGFSTDHHAPVAVKTLAHITLANFLATEEMEPTICKWMQTIFGSSYSFPVLLNRYSGFPPHTIYLNVENAQPFQQLAKKLKPVTDFIQDSNCPPVKLITKPHLTIARRLSAEVYHKAMTAYTQQSFHGSFLLEEFVLLRRLHQFDKCKTIQVFRLKPGGSNLFGDAA